MIVYKDILQKLKAAGYSPIRLRKEKILSESTIQRIRESRPIKTDTLDVICDLIGCDVSDLIEHKK